MRVWGKRRRSSRSTKLGGYQNEDAPIHLPSDDPLWQEHSEKLKTSRAKQRRKRIWAAGTAGSVGAAGVGGAGGSCSAGCGGGGGCGGGCGGG